MYAIWSSDLRNGQRHRQSRVREKADLIILSLAHRQLVPLHHIPNALVYQAYGSEVETSIIDGTVVMENRQMSFLGEGEERELYREAQAASLDVARRGGLQGLDRGWISVPGDDRR